MTRAPILLLAFVTATAGVAASKDAQALGPIDIERC